VLFEFSSHYLDRLFVVFVRFSYNHEEKNTNYILIITYLCQHLENSILYLYKITHDSWKT